MQLSFQHIFAISALILVVSCSFTAAQEFESFSDLTFVTEDYPPFNYVDNGALTGLMVDIVTAITRKAGDGISRDSISVLPWSTAYQKALNEPGVVIFSIGKTPEREELFSWVGPVVSSDIALFSSRSRNISITDMSELASYTVGTVTDDLAYEYVVNAGVPKDAIITGDDPYSLIQYLDDGTIDLFAYDKIAADYHIRNATGKSGFYAISGSVGSFPIYVGFSRGTPDNLIQKFSDAFMELKNPPIEGGMSECDQILSTWLLDEALLKMEYLTEGYYPYTFLEEGVPKGISVDVLQQMFSRLNIDVPDDHFVFGTWEDVYQQTLHQNGSAIIVMARSPERENLFRWAGPIDKTSNQIFCLRETADTLKEITPSEMKIGAVIDDIAASDLVNANVTDIVYFQDAREIINALKSGLIDGWAYAAMPARQLIQEYAADPASIVPVHTLKTYDYYFAFSPDTPAPLVAAFQDMFDIIRTEKDNSGVSMYERILYRYIEPSYSESTVTEEEVITLVNQTVSDLATDAEGTKKKINAGLSPYRDANRPDLYIFVYDTNVNMVAHADNIRMVGMNYHNKTDVSGKPFRDLILKGAQVNGSGWEDYIYSSPAESGLFWKTTRYQIGTGSDGKEYIVCCGMYRERPE